MLGWCREREREARRDCSREEQRARRHAEIEKLLERGTAVEQQTARQVEDQDQAEAVRQAIQTS